MEFYTFIANNYAPFYSVPIECTERDAPYVLDGLLYHESDLDPEEHHTDTHGYTVILTPVGYTLMQGRGERGRWSPTSPAETRHPRLGSRRSLPALLP